MALLSAAVGVPCFRPLTAVVGVRADGNAALAITNNQQRAGKEEQELQAALRLTPEIWSVTGLLNTHQHLSISAHYPLSLFQNNGYEKNGLQHNSNIFIVDDTITAQ